MGSQELEMPEEISLDVRLVDHERKLLRERRTVLLSGGIGGESTEHFIQDMTLLQDSKDPIDIMISSSGGTVVGGLACIRAINEVKRLGIRVRGHVYGQAMSMAFLILQCCNYRTMDQGSMLMAHGITSFTFGDMRNLESERKLLRYWQSYFSELVASRTTPKAKYANVEFWHRVMEDDTPQFYCCEEGLKMGLVDEVLA